MSLPENIVAKFTFSKKRPKMAYFSVFLSVSL